MCKECEPIAVTQPFNANNYSSELSELVLRLTRQIVMHDPIGECRINGSPQRWNDLPVDKSLFGVNHIPMPNGYLSKNEECGTADGAICAKGLPIGNLPSQWFGNFYLNRLDHFVKHTLGVRYYGRYVDDFVIVHPDREYLKALIPELERFLKEELFLTLHPRKRYLQHYSKGVSFLGVTIRRGALLTGTRTKTGAYEAIRKWGTLSSMRLLTPGEMLQFRDSINSYWGLMRHHNSYQLRKKMSSKFTAQINNRISYAAYCKISMRDYTLIRGSRMIPYVEWWKLFERDRKDKKTDK